VAFLTFRDIGALDAQLDEAKIAFGEVRTLKRLSETEWAGIGVRCRKSRIAMAAPTASRAAPGISPATGFRVWWRKLTG
jgi:hypothetical protein